MRGVIPICLLALSACKGEEPAPSPPPGTTEPTAHTADTAATTLTTSPQLTATCVVGDNPLRGRCEITVSPQQPVELVFTGDGIERTYTLPESGVVDWAFIAPEKTIDWRVLVPAAPAVVVEGSFTTGPLPTKLELSIFESGEAHFEAVVGVHPCEDAGAIFASNSAGEVVWYHQLSDNSQEIVDIENVQISEDGTLLMTVDRRQALVLHDEVYEVTFGGETLHRWQQNTDYVNNTHHDVTKHDGVVYALSQRNVRVAQTDVQIDEVIALFSDNSSSIVWSLEDEVQIPRRESDFSHANAIGVYDDGLFVGFRHLSAITWMPFVAPQELGPVQWSISGLDDPLFSGPLEWISGHFEMQHDPNPIGENKWLVFDNRSPPAKSRVVVLEVDEDLGTVNEVRSHLLPEHCPFQGGARMLPDGMILATCAPTRRLYGFAAEDVGGDWSYGLELDCKNSGNRYISRLIPYDHPQQID